MKTQIAEQQISPQLALKIAPDVVSPAGQQKLQEKAVAANRIKGMLDQALQMAANKLQGHASTRVKDLDTAQKKVVQKRVEGRPEYDIDDLRDILGGRIVVDKKNVPQAKTEIQEMSKQGLFKIKKEEQRNEGNYNAYHYDIKFPTGDLAEIQIHTPQSALEAVSNHTIRANYGEKPPKTIAALQKIQAEKAHSLPNDKAFKGMQIIQQLEKQQDGKTSPIQSAAVLASQVQK